MDETASLADQKLQLEIEQMKTPWWKKPSSYFVWMPVLIVGGTLWFDLSVQELKREFEVVNLSLEDVRSRKAALEQEVSGAVSSLAQAKTHIEEFITQADRFKDQFKVVQTEAGESRYEDLRERLGQISKLISTTCAHLDGLVPESPPDDSDPCA